MPSFTRRAFLRQAATAGLALALPSWAGLSPNGLAWAAPHAHQAPAVSGNPLPLPGPGGLYGLLAPAPGDAPLTLTAAPAQGALPGRPGSPFLAYHARQGGKDYLNPVLRLQKGQDFQAELVNGLDQPTVIHWHGVDADWTQAGHPRFAVAPGARLSTRFPVTNRAGTYWYHPHPHGLTAPQAYFGLASFFLVEDEEERALSRDLGLEPGVTDLPLLLQDKRFDPAGRLAYAPDGEERFMGLLGGTILVNGVENAVLAASRRLYRLRLLNGSTARIFHLELLSRGAPQPMVLMATDGGLLSRPVAVERFFLSPGERAEILVDLSRAAEGQEFVLSNRPFDPMHHEDMGGMEHGGMAGMENAGHDNGHGGGHGMAMPGMDMAGQDSGPGGGHGGGHGAAASGPGMAAGGEHGGGHGSGHADGGLPEGSAFPVLRLVAGAGPAVSRRIPDLLSSLSEPPAPPARVRDFLLAAKGRQWTINGLTYDMEATPVRVEQRGPELWRFVNQARSMPHPMHVHGYPFRVLSRQGSPEQVRQLAQAPGGLAATDLGVKDTVLVWPGETVAVALDFSTPAYAGEQTFLVHCHNLEHEDQGMMLNFAVNGEGTRG